MRFLPAAASKSFVAAVLASALLAIGGTAGRADDGDVVLLRVRVLFRDSQDRQPKYECPAEMICLRYPEFYTVDVRQVLSGDHLPRRLHAIFWNHTGVPQKRDLFVAGVRLPSGGVEANEWNFFDYAGCLPDEPRPQNPVMDKIKALREAGRLPCKKEP